MSVKRKVTVPVGSMALDMSADSLPIVAAFSGYLRIIAHMLLLAAVCFGECLKPLQPAIHMLFPIRESRVVTLFYEPDDQLEGPKGDQDVNARFMLRRQGPHTAIAAKESLAQLRIVRPAP